MRLGWGFAISSLVGVAFKVFKLFTELRLHVPMTFMVEWSNGRMSESRNKINSASIFEIEVELSKG